MRLHYVLAFLPLILPAQYKLETVVQKGHAAAVKSVTISPDNKLVATGSRDRTVKIWDSESRRELRSFTGADLTLNSVQFSADGKWIAAGSFDQYARIWEVNTGKLIFTSPQHDKYITDVAFTPDGSGLLVGGFSDSLVMYRISDGKVIRKIMVNSDQNVNYGAQIKFSPDGKWLAVGEDDRTAKIYRTSDWSLVYTFKPKVGWCGGCGTKLAFSNDSKLFAKFSHNDVAEVYDLTTGTRHSAYNITEYLVGGLIFSPDASKLYVMADTMLNTIDLATKTRTDSVRISKYGLINEIAIDKDGKNLFLACDHNTTIVWNIAEKKAAGALEGILQQVDKGGLDYDPDSYWQSHIAQYTRLKNTISLSPDNHHFASGKIGRKAVWWNLDKGNPEKVFDNHAKAVLCLEHSLDGKMLATADAAGEAKLWDISEGKEIRTIAGHKHPILCMSLSPNGEQIALGSWDASVTIWNIASGKREMYLDFESYSPYSMSFTPDGLYFVTGRLDKSLELYEPDSRKLVRSFVGHSDIVSSISFGPDKYKMLSASWDGSARIWDVTTGILLQKFKTSNVLHAAIFTPDGKRIITAGDDRIIRIWDVASGKTVKTLEGHQTQITSLQITSDGKSLLSYSLDGVIKCWNLDKGAEFYEHIHLSDRDWMAKTKEGYFNATSGARNAIHFVRGLEVFKPEQFFDEYYRPDLLSAMFKSRGMNSTATTLETRLQQSPPAVLKVAVVPMADNKRAEIHVRMTDVGGGVSGIKILHNGKNMEVKTSRLKLPQSKNETTLYVDTVELVGGVNIFEAIGVNKANIESQPAAAQYMAHYAPNAAVCHVFAIGINEYKNPSMELNYARNDAESFVEVFRKKGVTLYKDIRVHALYDEKATRVAILDTLDKLSKIVAPHDVFVFYYAGHGSMNDNKFYFIPQECTRLYEAGTLSKSAIEATEVQLRLQKIKALKQIIIMDACQSGGSVELLAMRGGMEEKAMAQLSRSAGIHVLASAGSEQNAKEVVTLKHGLFTYVLLKALEGSADGAPDDGKITLYELKSYLDDQVPELNKEHSHKIQYPYTFSRGHDFPLVLE